MILSNLPNLTPGMFVEVVKAIDDLQDNATKESVTDYTGKSLSYVQRALVMGIELDLVEKNGSTYRAIKYHDLPSQDLVKSALSDYEPFVFFLLQAQDRRFWNCGG